MPTPPALRSLWKLASWSLKPNQRLRWTRAGVVYLAVWLLLLTAGLYQQVNLILLVAGMAAGPLVASFLISASMLRRVRVGRRSPPYVFSGEPLTLDYSLENRRRANAALALTIEDVLAPSERSVPGGSPVSPMVRFSRVAPGQCARVRWRGPSPERGRYRFGTLELVTRSPFGLIERRDLLEEPAEILVYPRVGHLARRWGQIHREATETRRGTRHDRSAQQQEYHGLREYRPGDSPRWIHWRTTARIGKPMVKEFEQQNDQDLAILIDPWLPRTKATPEQRETVEAAIRFAATVCLETCRHTGRRLLLGWTGPTPEVRQGPASVKLLHELLEGLAVLRPSPEGQVSALLDALPPAIMREAMIVLISTRPVNLAEEAEKTTRLAGASARGLIGRILRLDASRGDLDDLIAFDGRPAGEYAQPPVAEARP